MPAVDERKYHEWFRTEGGRQGRPLDADSWTKARRDIRFMQESGLDLATITPAQARLWLVKKVDRGEAGHGRVNNLRTELLRWFRYRDGATPHLPRWREEDPREKALTHEQKFTALGYAHADRRLQIRNRFMIYFALASGAEPSEVAGIRIADFDLDRLGVHITRPCKGHARRFVPLPVSVLTYPKRPSLLTWLKHRPPPPDGSDALFTSRPGPWGPPAPLTPAGLTREMQKVRLQTGVPINWQVTRHTFATDLLEAGFGERYVMKVLGLRNMMHLPRYAEARPDALAKKYRSLTGLDPYQGA